MARPKGSEKKGGREKGTPNKLTVEVKDRLKKFLDNNYDEFEDDVKGLDPALRTKTYLEVCKLILPKPRDKEEEEKDRNAALGQLAKLFVNPNKPEEDK